MIAFCPTCDNMLLVEADEAPDARLRYYCQTCPYVYNINEQITRDAILKQKKRDEVHGSEEGWKGKPRNDATPCPKCQHRGAYFQEIQTRSADEPATLFFRCVKCAHNWKEG